MTEKTRASPILVVMDAADVEGIALARAEAMGAGGGCAKDARRP